MQSLIKISDASVIAVHSMDYMFQRKKNAYSAKEISGKMNVSYNHLSKVLQRLTKADFVGTRRGPSGGYYLTEKGKKARLGEIIKAVEGAGESSTCFLDPAVCGRTSCAMRNFLDKTRREFEKLLGLRLGDF